MGSIIIFTLPITIITYIFILINFIGFIFTQKQITKHKIFKFIELWTVTILPCLFLLTFDINKINNCCGDSAVFAPGQSIGIYFLLIIYTVSYTISIFRKNIFPPISELLLNLFLVLGLIINILLCTHLETKEEGSIFWILGNIPIIMLLLMKLYHHHKLLILYISKNKIEPNGKLGKICFLILNSQPIIKFPLLALLIIPVIIFISIFLILFGQKPDSLIATFTDTYKHGFSQLDYMCDNVHCGGHFLCSVGANGHKKIVNPIRYGERNGGKIICNRQLLISNAFEEFIQENLPKTHKLIRKIYNKVGNFIHRYYSVFNIKIVSDIVYIIMKPLEWFFLLTLYTFDSKPENRISVQYLNIKERELIRKKLTLLNSK